MNASTRIPPTIMEMTPFRMESLPSEGPTFLSSSTFTGAGRAPARSAMARSWASSRVKRPVICALPPEMRSCMTGAE